MNVETGYLTPTARAHPERNVVVHARLVGGTRTFCGAQIADPLDFAFVHRGPSLDHPNCSRCQQGHIYKAVIAVSGARRTLLQEGQRGSRARRTLLAQAQALLDRFELALVAYGVSL